jgi:serine/threonine-protein kinase
MGAQTKSPSLEKGVILNGKWEIIDHLATGGKGEVYRARQTNLDREVVVKTISREYLANLDGDEDYIETELQRLHREALAMARVRHPYVVQVYDQDKAVVTANGIQQSVQYLVMEYIDGPTLRSTMPSEGFCSSEQEAREWIGTYFLPVLDGIQAIHDLGIVHRDVKPENVLLDHGTPKIMDFGLAGGVRWSGLTKSHHVEGTITYMAPEQFIDFGETDVRGDVYALGKILYEAVTGKMEKKTAYPLKGVCLEAADSPFWKRLDGIVRETTAEDPDQRISSAKDLRERLEVLLDDFDESKLHFMGVALPRPNRKQLALGIGVIAFVIGLIIISNLIHHQIMVSETGHPGESGIGSAAISGRDKPSESTSAQRGKTSPSSDVIGKDESILRAVPGGDFTLPEYGTSHPGRSFHVGPFLMGETEVTNGQYVKFLNQLLDKISVENGVVQSNGKTWLVLGKAFSGYEPIVFRNGRFSLRDSRYSSYPVVRVTAYGASAYAAFYGKRLPTEFEWYAAATGTPDSPKRPVSNKSKSHGDSADLEQEMEGLVDAYGALNMVETDSSSMEWRPSRIPYPVSHYSSNRYGIRGLRSNVGEWGLRSPGGNEENTAKPKYVILGGLDGTWLLGSTLIRGSKQNPSEASVSVGFRVVGQADARLQIQEQ